MASPEEYMIWIFWEMTSGIIFQMQCSWFDSGYMYGVSLLAVSHIFFVNVNSDPEGTLSLSQRQVFTVQTVQQTVKISQVQFLALLLMRPLLCSDRCRVSDSTEFRGDSAVAVRCCGSSTRSSLSEGGFVAFRGIFRTPSAWT